MESFASSRCMTRLLGLARIQLGPRASWSCGALRETAPETTASASLSSSELLNPSASELMTLDGDGDRPRDRERSEALS
eukprot:4107700-Lingulodinium_polyedra.AAC.1